ncbi:hypothetical protein EDEG_01705 [Edhazardia aedis USNM 41457]|uniref:RDRP core domain-containing protein n=1 Tax=Edhazardia aedis (strain USNM 41457) TaxID=1003232 RepID=J9D8A7_EDHAE|nr:hypothetical protein EDEG_01705 [Edhazardia aedis USNM 41457]|eukprot:EJW04011.1 hypothetical protein EDEG_01705 [Edhazardia aedis USNM 41457]
MLHSFKILTDKTDITSVKTLLLPVTKSFNIKGKIININVVTSKPQMVSMLLGELLQLPVICGGEVSNTKSSNSAAVKTKISVKTELENDNTDLAVEETRNWSYKRKKPSHKRDLSIFKINERNERNFAKLKHGNETEKIFRENDKELLKSTLKNNINGSNDSFNDEISVNNINKNDYKLDRNEKNNNTVVNDKNNKICIKHSANNNTENTSGTNKAAMTNLAKNMPVLFCDEVYFGHVNHYDSFVLSEKITGSGYFYTTATKIVFVIFGKHNLRVDIDKDIFESFIFYNCKIYEKANFCEREEDLKDEDCNGNKTKNKRHADKDCGVKKSGLYVKVFVPLTSKPLIYTINTVSSSKLAEIRNSSCKTKINLIDELDWLRATTYNLNKLVGDFYDFCFILEMKKYNVNFLKVFTCTDFEGDKRLRDEIVDYFNMCAVESRKNRNLGYNNGPNEDRFYNRHGNGNFGSIKYQSNENIKKFKSESSFTTSKDNNNISSGCRKVIKDLNDGTIRWLINKILENNSGFKQMFEARLIKSFLKCKKIEYVDYNEDLINEKNDVRYKKHLYRDYPDNIHKNYISGNNQYEFYGNRIDANSDYNMNESESDIFLPNINQPQHYYPNVNYEVYKTDERTAPSYNDNTYGARNIENLDYRKKLPDEINFNESSRSKTYFLNRNTNNQSLYDNNINKNNENKHGNHAIDKKNSQLKTLQIKRNFNLSNRYTNNNEYQTPFFRNRKVDSYLNLLDDQPAKNTIDESKMLKPLTINDYDNIPSHIKLKMLIRFIFNYYNKYSDFIDIITTRLGSFRTVCYSPITKNRRTGVSIFDLRQIFLKSLSFEAYYYIEVLLSNKGAYIVNRISLDMISKFFLKHLDNINTNNMNTSNNKKSNINNISRINSILNSSVFNSQNSTDSNTNNLLFLKKITNTEKDSSLNGVLPMLFNNLNKEGNAISDIIDLVVYLDANLNNRFVDLESVLKKYKFFTAQSKNAQVTPFDKNFVQNQLNLDTERGKNEDFCVDNAGNKTTTNNGHFFNLINTCQNSQNTINLYNNDTDFNTNIFNKNYETEVTIPVSTDKNMHTNTNKSASNISFWATQNISTRSIIVTPLQQIYTYPTKTLGNRVLRTFNADFFIRVSFKDENLTSVRKYDSNKFIFEKIRKIMKEGFLIGNRKYFFLAMSASQLKTHSAWFICPYLTNQIVHGNFPNPSLFLLTNPGNFKNQNILVPQNIYTDDNKPVSTNSNNIYSSIPSNINGMEQYSKQILVGADYIRQWLGTFSTIKNIGKYAIRLGQALSSTIGTIEIDNLVCIDDKFFNGYCFTDGIGRIDYSTAKKVCECLGIINIPSAFQIRIGGYKGVVSLYKLKNNNEEKKLKNIIYSSNTNTNLNSTNIDTNSNISLVQSNSLYVRNSMKKFESTHRTLEVVAFSQNIPCYLNRQIILILCALGINDNIIIEMQDNYIEKIAINKLQIIQKYNKEMQINKYIMDSNFDAANNIMQDVFTTNFERNIVESNRDIFLQEKAEQEDVFNIENDEEQFADSSDNINLIDKISEVDDSFTDSDEIAKNSNKKVVSDNNYIDSEDYCASKDKKKLKVRVNSTENTQLSKENYICNEFDGLSKELDNSNKATENNIINIIKKDKILSNIEKSSYQRCLKSVDTVLLKNEITKKEKKLQEDELHVKNIINVSESFLQANKLLGERFYLSIYDTTINKLLEATMSKSKIFICKGRLLIGILDEYDVLEENQVFIRFSNCGNECVEKDCIKDRKSRKIKSDTKNQCFSCTKCGKPFFLSKSCDNESEILISDNNIINDLENAKIRENTFFSEKNNIYSPVSIYRNTSREKTSYSVNCDAKKSAHENTNVDLENNTTNSMNDIHTQSDQQNFKKTTCSVNNDIVHLTHESKNLVLEKNTKSSLNDVPTLFDKEKFKKTTYSVNDNNNDVLLQNTNLDLEKNTKMYLMMFQQYLIKKILKNNI